MVATLPPPDLGVVQYRPRGAAWALFDATDPAFTAPEVLIEGPFGTGKTVAALWKIHAAALDYPGMRGLVLRKTNTALRASALVSFKKHVLGSGDYGVRYFGGNTITPAQFEYPNGSVIVVGGVDQKAVFSTEYDLAYINEAIELTLEEWETLLGRMRNGVMPYQQLIGDCNPDTPTHWLNQRADTDAMLRLISRHKDNPRYWDAKREDWTDEGRAYVVGKLDHMTGVRYKRYRLGLWVAAEGQVYEGFDPAIHVIDRFEIPPEWPRYWAIDFGYVNPFVWQWWAQEPDGGLIMYREIYMTRRLVTDHVAQGLALSANEPRPIEIVTDHDAEDRATLEDASGYRTMAAMKDVSPGIQAVAERLRPLNGTPRLRFMRDSLVERDQELVDAGKPTSTVEEFPGYVWNTGAGRRKGEEPVKANDHGMDDTRYMVAHVDLTTPLTVEIW
jgi:phage terminase large subunit